ncbi:MAG: ATP-binding protein [Saprospiraceae bacterium]|nr:ATP-binding protein [Saprospiraceae bacterium]
MKYIERIEINYFRSINKAVIKDVKDLNIFSGLNDSGKSNILLILDSYFNNKNLDFLHDYNKDRLNTVRKESVKGKQFIKVKITFNNPGSYTTLPKKFSITKKWDREGILYDNSDDLSTYDKNGKISNLKRSRTSLHTFINKIKFIYVPAIRDKRFFQSLLINLQEILFSKNIDDRSNKIQSILDEFNAEIDGLTSDLNKEYFELTKIKSTLNFPKEISQLFERLIINTISGEYNIPLNYRGDGIRMRYIPVILNYIAKNNTRNFYIWGFDEPENSCEYSLINAIAKDFMSEYTNNAQIFACTHSFSFITLNNPIIVQQFRVKKDEKGENTLIIPRSHNIDDSLNSDLGIYQLNKELDDIYKKYSNEIENIEELKLKVSESEKSTIMFEGITDNMLFTKAYNSLYDKDIDDDYLLSSHYITDNGSAIGSGAHKLNHFFINHLTRMRSNQKIIIIFDADEEGLNQLKGILKCCSCNKIELNGHIVYQHKDFVNAFVTILAVPEFRNDFFDIKESSYCYVSTELLLKDDQIPNANRKFPSKNDHSCYSFTGKKVKFADKIIKKDDVDYQGFAPTFDLIKEIERIST